ncbi:hypothetical protein KY290_028875 [Solanum tuberosum]|uniref:Uncharacterized protein n=1 Tax=Solanum tuberosum TaxID=4113 RepID=A0ABQ7UJ56_SOLTU|nr:hypothetical protein KY290_028875 [Solanum tuberosum]
MKLLIDNKAGKVLFAEAEKDCVDFLFHILSLPVVIVVSFLKEKGMNWCLHNLYQSVQNLNDTCMKSNEAKNILLKPKSSIEIISSVPKRSTINVAPPAATSTGFVTYMEMDDLVVKPMSTVSTSLMSRMLALKASFKSKAVLTSTVFMSSIQADK